MTRSFVPRVFGEVWDGTNVSQMANVVNVGDPNATVRRNAENGTELQYLNADETVAFTFKYGDGYLVGYGFVSANNLAGSWQEV